VPSGKVLLYQIFVAEGRCRIATYAEFRRLGGAEVDSIGFHGHASDAADLFVLTSMINYVREHVAQ